MAREVRVELPDGSERELPEGATGTQLALAIGPGLAKAALAAEVDGKLVDLSAALPDGASVSIVTPETDPGRDVIRHSTAHVMAQAVLRLWHGARFAIGPVIADGFYYDFELPTGAHFTEEDLAAVDAAMREIIAEDQPFVRQELSVTDALVLFAGQPYKQEIIEAVAAGADEVDAAAGGIAAEGAATGGTVAGGTDAGGTVAGGTVAGGTVTASTVTASVSTYRNTEAFVDLCRGPHVPSTGRLGHFKLMRVAGAYWRGDERRQQLQRIYGTAWESDAALASHLHHLEEAERRDHRRLGHELDLFSFPEEIGSGLAVFHPKGGIVRREMEDYSRRRHADAGYDFVYSPHITRASLFEESGHVDWFADSMYPPMELDDGSTYYVKPMNCPFHILVYRSRQRSYRELPMRLFEFGSVYRYEKSGVVHGLTRVRGLTMDDAHIFCARDQMAGELSRALTFVLDLLRDFGLDEFWLELSTKPEGKAVGSDAEWDEATDVLRDVADGRGLELVRDEGGGAFYGPKISVQARDAIGRNWQMSTVQLDFQLPQRFGLEYIGSDNAKHRPVMIHRALFGSVERFFGVLLEHYAGNLPTWLSPVQVRVLPVRDDHVDYAASATERFCAEGLRAEMEDASEPLGTRIRRGKLEKVPYVLVVGDDDVAAGTVGVNRRGDERPERGVLLDDAVARVRGDAAARRTAPQAE